MLQKYFEIAYEDVKGACAVEHLSERESVWDLSIGQSQAAAWPKKVSFRMSADHPKDVALIDYISNRESSLLVSPRFRDFFQEQQLPELEFLPVAILDHKGRVASDQYSIVNCLRIVDCVDQQNSAFRWDGLDPPSMVARKVALNPESLGEDDRMIRPKFVPGKILLSEDLVQAINAGNFSGVAFTRKLFGDNQVYRRPR
jgi:hypothetical protein